MTGRGALLTCPAGHEFRIAPIVYGYPSPETFEAAERGDVTIGGCMPDLPVQRPCPKCGLTASSDLDAEIVGRRGR
ncbi:MAG: hypothetical protein WKF78_11055 [Candidatus Limnocylindrales bacterium]